MCGLSLLLGLVGTSVAQDLGSSITGRVLDINGVGVAHAYAELQLADARDNFFQARSDDFGAFRFPRLAPGDYSLKLSSAGFESLTIKSRFASRIRRRNYCHLLN